MARHVGLAEETAYGTAETDFPSVLEVLNESIQSEYDWQTLAPLRNYSPVSVESFGGVIRGDIEVLANYHGIGLLYKHMLAGVDTTGSDPYTHTFPPSTGIPTTDRIGLGLTIEALRDDSRSWRYAGCKVNSMSHSFGIDGPSTLRFGFVGKSEALAGPDSSVTYPTWAPMLPSHVTIDIDTSTSLPCRSVELTVENPVDEPKGLGSTTLVAEPDRNDILKVTGRAELYFEDTTLYGNIFDSSAEFGVTISAVNGTTTALYYVMAKCRALQFTPHNSGRERLFGTLEWESYYNSAATENLQVILLNSDASY